MKNGPATGSLWIKNELYLKSFPELLGFGAENLVCGIAWGVLYQVCSHEDPRFHDGPFLSFQVMPL